MSEPKSFLQRLREAHERDYLGKPADELSGHPADVGNPHDLETNRPTRFKSDDEAREVLLKEWADGYDTTGVNGEFLGQVADHVAKQRGLTGMSLQDPQARDEYFEAVATVTGAKRKDGQRSAAPADETEAIRTGGTFGGTPVGGGS